MFTQCIQVLPEEALKMKEFWFPCHSKNRNVTERQEMVLQHFYKRFSTFLNADKPTLRAA